MASVVDSENKNRNSACLNQEDIFALETLPRTFAFRAPQKKVSRVPWSWGIIPPTRFSWYYLRST